MTEFHPAERSDDSHDTQPARHQHDRYHKDSGHQPSALDWQDEERQADQKKEHDVENFVDEFPEGVDVLARLLRHRECPTLVPHEQAGDHDGNRRGEMQGVRQGEQSHGQSQREQDFHLVIVDTLEDVLRHESRGHREHQGATDFREQESSHPANPNRLKRRRRRWQIRDGRRAPGELGGRQRRARH